MNINSYNCVCDIKIMGANTGIQSVVVTEKK